jgi:4'-phosphopantetheinyl transferase
MSAILKQSGDQPLPGPGIYRFGAGEANIYVCLIGLANMLRQYLPEVEPKGYQTLKGRVFDAGALRKDFLSGDEIRQLNCFKALKKQVEWIGGRFALKTVVSKILPEVGDAKQIQVAYEPRGAPYLVNTPENSISISHAGEYALAGVCSDAHTRIGLDIERIGVQGLDHVMRVAFTDREIEAAAGSPEAACRIWTRKEAYLKFVKTGFRESLKRVDVSGGTIIHGGVLVNGLGTKTLGVGKQHMMSIVYSQMKRNECNPERIF